MRRVEPLASDWRSFSWASGSFDSARRGATREVAGVIAVPHHLLLVTLSGGARRLEVQADCGHSYAGEDFAGAVSFVPAGCARRFAMNDVRAGWASISLRADLLDVGLDIPTFTNLRDPLIASVVGELARLQALEELDPQYCDAMSRALALHLARRYANAKPTNERRTLRLPAWRLRKLSEYIEAHLQRPILVEELARAVGLSAGHLHRALRATTGKSPLDFIHERRMARASRRLLEGASITVVCREIGFASPSHFARVFRRSCGVSPAAYRDGLRRSKS